MRKNRMLVRTTLALAAVAAVAAVGVGAASARQANVTVNGAGSTFVAPLVQKWVSPVASQLHLTLNYSAVGSGAGIAAIENRTVDFGASDAPLQPADFTACKGCLQIPWALAGTAVDYRVDNVSATLKLTGAVLANIYLGKVKYWDDKTIKALNKGVHIPHTAISVFHRSDGSGTTYNFTDYLSHVSSTWKHQVGTGTAVNWPTGTGESHSSGVVAAVKATNGGIGYTDVEYAIQNKVKYAFIQNKSGSYTQPTLGSIKAASLLDTTPKADGSLSIVNPPASAKYKHAYPICTYTYADVAIKSPNAAALKKLIGWAILDTAGKGQTYGPKILFVPIPKGVVTFDAKQSAKIHT
jgi:phosphate transport system substrate-binding protein